MVVDDEGREKWGDSFVVDDVAPGSSGFQGEMSILFWGKSASAQWEVPQVTYSAQY